MVTMKAAVFSGIRQIEVRDVPRPEPNPDEVLIRIAYCGICGSDLEAFQTGMYEPGLVPGHEFSGTLVEIGSEVTGWQVGDRVVSRDASPCGKCASCREGRLDACESLNMFGITQDGAWADYAKILATDLHRLPDSVSLRQGALVEPLSVALHGVRRSKQKPGDQVLVMGAGPVGLLTLQCALLAGARSIVVTEIDDTRAALASRLGASAVLNPLRENVGVALADLTCHRGPDVVYVCSGAPSALSEAVSLVRKGGQILVLGICVSPVETDYMTIAMNELSVQGSYLGWAEAPAAIDYIAQGRVQVAPLVSHEIELQDIVTQGMDVLERPGSGAVKILVRIGGEHEDGIAGIPGRGQTGEQCRSQVPGIGERE